VLDGGKLVAQGTADELKRLVPGGHILLTFRYLRRPGRRHPQAGRGRHPRRQEPHSADPSDGSAHSVQTVLDQIDGRTVSHLSLHIPDLDDVFFALTGRDSKKDQS
jgi:ABC-2 type transport system ATP-binding protein